MKLGYGKDEIIFDPPAKRLKGVLTPNAVETRLTGVAEVKRAMENPIASPRLKDKVKAGMKVSIVTSDITRPMPSKTVLPLVLEELNSAGVPDRDIVIIFGLGSHRRHTEAEMKYIVGEDVFGRIECVDSDETRCVRLGVTAAGTPVDIFDRVVNADFRICLGNIEYHYFAGYSGGAKAVMPGVSTSAAIRCNHSMMVNPEARAGNIDSPVRRDIEEAVSFLGVDYILNVVLDEHKNIIFAAVGDCKSAHRAGCDFLDGLYKVSIDGRADIVVVSAGGYPKDQNMYQAQKALDNAKHAVKDGGVIIWLAECREGFGSAAFEKWMKEKSPEQMIADIKSNFVLGGHKAAAVAQVLERADIYLVSDLDRDTVKQIKLVPFESLEKAFGAATQKTGADSTVYVMPYGGSTLPICSADAAGRRNIILSP